ncbi:SIT4 phosphatase-associated protein-domain-containing protein [Lipomyces oligophaga]|uniref:SIT4 phosphatase-associated protein-domain-containing protein n=1 Tax=Lipomyces oligophaga TaxID=45792 RepID=UPI0034CE60C5
MAFWRVANNFRAPNEVSGVIKRLDSPDCTLEDILDEDEILQEIRERNSRLIEYLREPDNLRQLLRFVSHWNPQNSFHETALASQSADALSQPSTDKNQLESSNFSISTDSLEQTVNEDDSQRISGPDFESNLAGLGTMRSDIAGGSQINADSTFSDNVVLSSDGNVEIEDAGDGNNDDDDDEHYTDESLPPVSRGPALAGLDSLTEENDMEEDDDMDQDDEDLGLTRIAASPEGDASNMIDDEKAWRYARIATEIFSAEIWSISDTVMDHPELLDEFWTFLDNPAPLDTIYAGYFTKTNEQFIDRKTDQMIDFLKTQTNLVERFMHHIDTPAIMDLLLKILCTDKIENPTGIIETLQEQHLIPSLIGFLTAETPSNSQSAAGDFLKALVTISANATNDFTSIGPNELIRELVSTAVVAQLADQMISSGGTALATAVGVIIELIRKNNSDYDPVSMMSMTIESNPPSSRDPVYLGYLLRVLAKNIPRFQSLLAKRHDNKLETSFGSIEPLGFERFKICELIAELLHCSNMALLNDPGAEAVAIERDTIRMQLRRSRDVDDVDTEASTFITGNAGDAGLPDSSIDLLSDTEPEVVQTSSVQTDSPVSDLGNSVHGLSVDESEAAEGSISDSRGWWSLGKKKANSPESLESAAVISSTVKQSTPTIVEDAAAEEEGDIQGSNADGAEISRIKSGDVDDKIAEIIREDQAEEIENKKEVNGGDGDSTGQEESDNESESEAVGSKVPDLEEELQILKDAETTSPQEVDPNLVVGAYLKSHLIEYRVVSTIVKLFFKFPWNNFLHNVVFDIIQQIFNGPVQYECSELLILDLFLNDKITMQIVDGTTASDEYESSTRMRLGYMGHLTLISEEVIKCIQRCPLERLPQGVLDLTERNAKWNHYVNETLNQIRTRDNYMLGGPRTNADNSAHQQLLLTMGDMVDVNGMGDDDRELGAEYADHDGIGVVVLDDDDDDEDDDDDRSNRPSHGQSNDHWSRYMSQQMTPDRFGSSDEDDEDEEVEDQDEDRMPSARVDDDYIDSDQIGVELSRTSSHEL